MDKAFRSRGMTKQQAIKGASDRARKQRAWLLLVVLACALLSLVAALKQAPAGNPFRKPQSSDLFFYPIEYNPVFGLVPLSGNVRDLALVPGSEGRGLLGGRSDHLWLVGDGGFAAQTLNGGRDWLDRKNLGKQAANDPPASAAAFFLNSAIAGEEKVPSRINLREPRDLGQRSAAQTEVETRAPVASENKEDSTAKPIEDIRDALGVDRLVSELLGNYQRVQFQSSLNGVITTSGAAAYRTEDGGDTWIADSNAPARLIERELNLRGLQYPGPLWRRAAMLNPDSDRWYFASPAGSVVSSDAEQQNWHWHSRGAQLFVALKVVEDQSFELITRVAVLGSEDGQRWHYKRELEDPDKAFARSAFGAYQSGRGSDASNRSVTTADGEKSVRIRDDGRLEFQLGKTGDWLYPAYQRWPALWLWPVLLFWLAIGALIFWRPLPEEAHETSFSVSDMLASDRPLQPGDPDPLQFGAIARGLSRFIRNPATEPPLTIAITGKWGTGKSSMMNLLFHDLQQFGFKPVWFNAWHHQKGEQILASLYANIRAQAVPGWFHFARLKPVGLSFRLQLLAKRSLRQKALYIGGTIVFFTALTILLRKGFPDAGDFLADIQTLFKGDLSVDGLNSGLMIALVSLLAPMISALMRLKAFGISPEKLIAGAKEAGEPSAPVDPAARYRFSRDFGDVTDSLELGSMVIFIDDLDRCSKENVLDIMEAINFLAASGKCYIILGMAEDWVKTCIGLGFAELAQEANGGNGTQSRQQFAEEYLEKLINIKVPVPVLDGEDGHRLLQPALPPEDKRNIYQRIVGGVFGFVKAHRFASLFPLAMMTGLFLGSIDFDHRLETSEAAGEGSELVAPKKGYGSVADREVSTVYVGKSQAQDNLSWYLLLLIPAVLLGLAAWDMATRQPPRIERDSPEFEKALGIWQHWILYTRHTPRAVKRYLNRVRYLAMRYRPESREYRWFHRLLGINKPAAAEQQQFHEADLVALSALYSVCPGLLRNPGQLAALGDGNFSVLDEYWQSGEESISDEQRAALAEALSEHMEQFGNDAFSNPDIQQQFMEVVADVAA